MKQQLQLSSARNRYQASRNSRWLMVCALLIGLHAGPARAQTNITSASTLTNVVVPYQLVRGHIVVLARVNESRQVSLMLDTGYTINMLSAEVIESLQLKRAGKITIVGIAGEREADV